MKADPASTLRQTEKLVKGHTREAYSQISELLAELRESLVGTEQSGLAEQQAEKLRKANPSLHMLVSELRRKRFLPK